MESAPLEETSATSSPASDWGRRRAGFAVWCVLVAAAFFKPLWDLARLATTDLHSHTILIPFVSAYLIYVERKRLPRQGGTAWGPAAILGCVALGLVAMANGFVDTRALGPEGSTALLVLALVALVSAGGFVLFGSPWMRTAAFPMAFLVFMVPMPEHVAGVLEHGLKLASAEASAILFDVFGVPVLRDGLIFRLPGITLEVAQECSGIRSSYVLFMTSLVAAFLFLRSPWRRALLVGFFIPLGIIRNGFRILVLGWLCVKYGPHMIDTWIHHRGGPVFFVLSLIPLFLLLGWLWRSENPSANRKSDSGRQGAGAPPPRST